MNTFVAAKDAVAPMITTIPTLLTERLILRPHRLEDFDDYVAFWSQNELSRYVGGEPTTREQTWSRMLRYAGLWHYLGFGFFAFEERATGRFIGEGGFLDMHRDMEPTTEGTIETGWAISPSLQGKGYATEAMRAALAWVTGQFPGRLLTCIINPENLPSLRVAEKLGFRETGKTSYKDRPYVMFERQ